MGNTNVPELREASSSVYQCLTLLRAKMGGGNIRAGEVAILGAVLFGLGFCRNSLSLAATEKLLWK
jgi:hypothetical protein